MTRRAHKCSICARTTKSVTRLCPEHRPADAIPVVHAVPEGISFGGLTFTTAQARRLADQIHDVLERGDS